MTLLLQSGKWRCVVRPGGLVVIGELGRYSPWAIVRRMRGWFGSKFWREAHFWTPGELRRLVESSQLEFGAVRGAVYYPPSRIMAKLLALLDRPLSQIMTAGAAFLCLRADKKPSFGAAKASGGRILASTQRLSFCVGAVSLLSFLLSAKMRLAGEKLCFRWRYYVEVVHRRGSRRLPPMQAHAANVLGSFFAGIRAASHRLPSQRAFART